MAILALGLMGDGIIWEGDGITAFRKRGSMVIESIKCDKAAIGFVGSDRVLEGGYEGFRETLEPIVNARGQVLRFGLIAYNALRARTKLANNGPLTVVTSYPVVAASVLGNANTYISVPGGVEAELRDRESTLDIGFELIQSGDTVRDNNLQIIEDDIMPVNLECLRTPYDW